MSEDKIDHIIDKILTISRNESEVERMMKKIDEAIPHYRYIGVMHQIDFFLKNPFSNKVQGLQVYSILKARLIVTWKSHLTVHQRSVNLSIALLK